MAAMADELKPKGGGYEVSLLSSDDCLCSVDLWLHSGSLAIDMALGGGYPNGRLTEIYGDSSTGKSLLGTEAIIEAQAQGWVTAMVDTESATSKPLMEQLGVDTDILLYTTPDTMEQVHEFVEGSVQAKTKRLGVGHPMLIVWDSIAASTTQTEQETVERDGLDKKFYAPGASQVSMWLRTGLVRTLARNNVCMIGINQVRTNIGVMFGDQDSTYGGKAIPFYSSVRIKLTGAVQIKVAGAPKGADPVGVMAKLRVVKNKVAPPFRTAKVPIYFGFGIDDAEAVYELMRDRGLITTSGGWNTVEIGGEKYKWQGSGDFVKADGIFDSHYGDIKAMLVAAYATAGMRPEAVELVEDE